MIPGLKEFRDKHKGKEAFSEDDLVRSYENFMLLWGWIPPWEFNKLSISQFWVLQELANKEIDRRNKEVEAMKK